MNNMFIDKKMAGKMARKIKKQLGPGFAQAVSSYKLNITDTLRFMPVANECVAARTQRGLDIKQVAGELKVPQYKITNIEHACFKDVEMDVLDKYVEYLGLEGYLKEWRENNRDLWDKTGTK